MQHPIDLAADVLGSQQALAGALGVTKAAVWQWKLNKRHVPVVHCVRIEQITNSAVTRKDLRPTDWQDIWPELAKPQSPKQKGGAHV